MIICLGYCLSGCSDNKTEEQVDLGYAYQPLKVGATWVYRVDSLGYDDNAGFTTIDTLVYAYRERLVETFKDVNGGDGFVIERAFQLQDTLPWITVNRWTVTKTTDQLQRNEENIRYVRLLFPLASRKKWDGNVFNNLGSQQYDVRSFDVPATINGTVYPQTATILQLDELNFIEELKREEVYARDVGLVQLVHDSLNTQVSGTRGFRYKRTLTSYQP